MLAKHLSEHPMQRKVVNVTSCQQSSANMRFMHQRTCVAEMTAHVMPHGGLMNVSAA